MQHSSGWRLSATPIDPWRPLIQAALKAAKQSQDGRDEEMIALHVEVQNLKDDAAAAVEQQQEAEAEAKSLCTMTQNDFDPRRNGSCFSLKMRISKYLFIFMSVFQEEVVLKRYWRARYWGLAIKQGNKIAIAFYFLLSTVKENLTKYIFHDFY